MTESTALARTQDPLESDWTLSRRLAQSSLMPTELAASNDKNLVRAASNVLVTLLLGRDLGISPMAAITGIHVIKGKPTLSASLMHALVLRAGHRLEVTETTSTRCTVRAQRTGGEPLELSWDLARAKIAGLTKDNWQRHPAAMLRSRAISEACKAVSRRHFRSPRPR